MEPLSLQERMRHKIRALRKRILSYRRSDWNLEDYPVALRPQAPSGNGTRNEVKPWVAHILPFGLSGVGNSPEEAMRELQKTFDSAKASCAARGERMLRPGVKGKVEFAPMERVSLYHDLGDDFVIRVLGYEWAILTDFSTLWDFHSEESNDALVTKIKEVYGVDVSDLKEAKLCDIFERIKTSRKSAS